MKSREFDHRPGYYADWELELANRRLEELRITYESFMREKALDTTKEWPFVINDTKLQGICRLFINDIKKFKRTHNSHHGTDNLKRAAYLSRWIAKIRPIEFDTAFDPDRTQDDYKNPELVFLNEQFAIRIFFIHLFPYDARTISSAAFLPIAKQLKYIFCQREISRDLLVALACATEIAINGGEIPVKPQPSSDTLEGDDMDLKG